MSEQNKIANTKQPLVETFDGNTFVVICCRPHSNVVEMTSNIATYDIAKKYAKALEQDGGHVFRILQTNLFVAACMMPKKDFID